MALSRCFVALAAFITADSLITFAVSAAVLCIFKCGNSLGTAAIIAAGVFVLQVLAAVVLLTAAQDFSNDIDAEGR